MTRVLEISPTRATNLIDALLGCGIHCVQAAPSRVCTVRFCTAPDGFDSSNETGIGAMIRLW